MKKIHILTALLGLVGASCSNQELGDEYKVPEQVKVTADFARSRVSFTETDNVTYANWETEDGITLNTSTQGNLNYSVTVSDTDIKFVPDGKSLKDIAGETVYACYPASTISDGTVDIPATNVWTDAKPLPFAYAVSKITDSEVNLAFEHTFAFLKMTLSAKVLKNITSNNGDNTVHRLLVKSASDSLAVVSGTFSFEEKSINTTEKSGEIELSLTEAFHPTEENERSVYIPILPQAGDTEMSISLIHDYEGGKEVLLEMNKQTPSDGFKAGQVYTLTLTGNSSAVIEGDSAEIYLAVGGSLSSFITDENKYSIKSLKLSGYLNGADLRLLRDMAGCDYKMLYMNYIVTPGKLTYLDMSDVHIVTDTDNAFALLQGSYSYLDTYCYTQENSISDYFFYGCGSLETVKIPNEVTEIGNYAFSKCYYLTDVYLPNGLLKIGEQAFQDCVSLTSFDIPNKVTDISRVFTGCSSLVNIDIPYGVTDISGAFTGCSSLVSINIPDGVSNIIGAFKNCSSLTDIHIPNGLTDISDAFQYCSSLTSIDIPESVTNISGAFQYCSSLTSIDIPENVTNISGAFYHCDSLDSINIPNGVTDLGENTFGWCTSLTNIKIPDGVVNIGSGVFEGTSLTDIYIPDGVYKIPGYAFYKCRSLKSIRIPNKVLEIGLYAFKHCDSLTEFYCYSSAPPTLAEYVFDEKHSIRLYVPKDCAVKYKNNSAWNRNFTTILEMEE